MWPLVNGVALANKDKVVFMLGSDGSQQEGDDAEAARLAVAQNLNVKLFIDDNDVTIACVMTLFARLAEASVCVQWPPFGVLEGLQRVQDARRSWFEGHRSTRRGD
jgi:transketolase N-terminal domain/subunit